MDPAIQRMLESVTTPGTRSGERLTILSSFVNTLPSEKLNKLKAIKVDWQSLDEELVPTLNVEFFE